MSAAQPEAIAKSRRVSNPGCYPTGGIALLRPLVETGLMAADYPVTVNAVSGYSGGGKSMIEAYERAGAGVRLYGLGLEHKHVPESRLYSELTRSPFFVPSVGNFRKGMLVSIPLHLATLNGQPKLRDLAAALENYYAGAEWVKVIGHPRPLDQGRKNRRARGQRHQPARAAGVRQRQPRPGGAGRKAGQSRQRRVGRGGAEHRHHARRPSLSSRPSTQND